MNIKESERYIPINLLGTGPRLTKKEFAGTRSNKGWETLLYSVHFGLWSNQTSYVVHIEGYFVLGMTYWDVRITTCHLLKTAMRLKMKKPRPHFPHYHNPFSLIPTPCTTRLIIHSRWTVNSNYRPARSVSMFVVDCVWNVMAQAQKPDFVFRRNGRVHLNRRGLQFRRQPRCAHQR